MTVALYVSRAPLAVIGVLLTVTRLACCSSAVEATGQEMQHGLNRYTVLYQTTTQDSTITLLLTEMMIPGNGVAGSHRGGDPVPAYSTDWPSQHQLHQEIGMVICSRDSHHGGRSVHGDPSSAATITDGVSDSLGMQRQCRYEKIENTNLKAHVAESVVYSSASIGDSHTTAEDAQLWDLIKAVTIIVGVLWYVACWQQCPWMMAMLHWLILLISVHYSTSLAFALALAFPALLLFGTIISAVN